MERNWMKMEKISVIIPVYNTATYLPRCLNSIINNTYRNLEIICINDGSTDNSLEILKDYEQRDVRIKVLDIPNSGVSQARNMGLEISSGDFISFVDSDDYIHTEFFSILMSFHNRYNVDVVACGFDRVYKETQEKPISSYKIDFSKIHGVDFINYSALKSYVWGKIYKSSIIGDVVFPIGINIAEDKVFNVELCSMNRTISAIYIKCNLYYYYYRADSALSNCNGFDFLNLGHYYLKLSRLDGDKYYNMIVLNEAFTNTFSGRYLSMFMNDKSVKKDVSELINECLSLERTKKPFSFRRSLVVRLMARFPIIYRALRLLSDKTMWDWEKKQKQKQKSNT